MAIFGSAANHPIVDWINSLKVYDYWKIFSRVAVGAVALYIMKIMKES